MNEMTNNARYGKTLTGEMDVVSPYPAEVWDLFRDIAAINAWLESANPRTPHEDSMRVMKVGEEYGEAVAAYIGMTGQNPRKGITHTETDLLAELADVAITALCAMQHFTGNTAITRGMLAAKIASIIQRSNITAA